MFEKLNHYRNNNPNPLPCVQLCITNFNLKLILNFEKTLWRGMEWRNQNTKLIWENLQKWIKMFNKRLTSLYSKGPFLLKY